MEFSSKVIIICFLIGPVFYTIGYTLNFTSEDILMIVLFAIVVSTGSFFVAGIDPLAAATLGDINPPKVRATIYSLSMVAQTVGRAVGIVICGALFISFGGTYQPGFIVMGIIYLSSVVFIIPLLKTLTSELKTDKGVERESGSLDQLRKKWERTNINTWDFEDLPEKIPLQSSKNKLMGYVYPCLLMDEQGHVSIKLLTDPEECRRNTREGILGLYSLQFPRQFKNLKKECSLPSSFWALYEGLGPRQQLSEDVYLFVLDEIFGSKNTLWPSKDEFFKLVDTIKKEGLFVRARQLIELVIDVLRERRATLDLIKRMESMDKTKSQAVFETNMFHKELAEAVPADFIQKFDAGQMTSAIRYCKALQIRMERAYASPEKDKVKAAQIFPFISRLEELRPNEPSPECLKLIQEYSRMLAEFKISIFAQEMKTCIPVSAKRLEKKWQEIVNSC